MKRFHGCAPVAVGVLLAIVISLFATSCANAQTTRIINDANSFTITDDSVRINMAGYDRTVPRDLVALASSPEHQHDVWDLRVLMARSSNIDGPINYTPPTQARVDSLLAIIDDLRIVGLQYRDERDQARSELASAQSERDALNAALNDALTAARAALRALTQ